VGAAVITLTQTERDKFAAWLEQEATTDRGLAEQAKKLGGAGEAINKKLTMDAVMKEIVARQLRTTETMQF
jgi:hypothetical protein